MKNLLKHTSTILLTLSILSICLICTAVFFANKQDSEEFVNFVSYETLQNEEDQLYRNTALVYVPNSNIYNINTTDIITYLEIKNTSLTSSLTSLSITQKIGNETITCDEDELNNSCKIDYNIHNNITDTFYFTRPALYTITYSLTTTTIVNSIPETTTQQYITDIDFSPSLVESNLEALVLSDHSSQIIHNNNKYYFFKSGTVNIELNTALYEFVAGSGITKDSDTVFTIPDSRYGTTNITIKSLNGFCCRVFDFEVMTLNFTQDFYTKNYTETNFDIDGDKINNGDYSKYCFNTDNHYVFNENLSIRYYIGTSNKQINGTDLNVTSYENLFENYKFNLTETIRSAVNNDNKDTITTELYLKENCFYAYLSNIDHSIFNINIKLKDNEIQYNELKNKLTFKIITKVPFVTEEKKAFDFAIYLHQTPYATYGEAINYLNQCLNGTLINNTSIYNKIFNGFRLYNLSSNKYAVTYTCNGSTINNEEFASNTIFEKSNENRKDYSINIKTTYDTGTIQSNFDKFYAFNFNIDLYDGGKTIYGSDNTATNLFSQTGNRLSISDTDDFNNYKPLFSMITYNGFQYENVLNFNTSSEFTFNEAGNYVIELFTLPSYSMALKCNELANGANTNSYYYKFQFDVSGASISASDVNGSINNNGFTHNTTTLNIQLANTQTYTLYKNNEVISSSATSTNNLEITEIGTYKVSILNSIGEEIKDFNFTLLNFIYQGFSINNKTNYKSLKVSFETNELPIVYEELASSDNYHLFTEGKYKIAIVYKESFSFLSGSDTIQAYREIEEPFEIELAKSFFKIQFIAGENGGRTTEKITISSISGVQLQQMEVYLNGKLEKVYDAGALSNYDSLKDDEKSFTSNGTYLIKLTDVFGNTYESQITKYYKTNFALILLIIIAVFLIVTFVLIITKARRKINVK